MLLPGETDGVRWVSLEEARSMVASGEICRVIGRQFLRQEPELIRRQDAQD